MRRKLPLAVAALAAVGMLAMAGTASAATVQSLFQHKNTASDNDAEYVVKDANNSNSGTLEVNDIIRGAFDISTLNHGSANLGGSTINNQWSGIFSIKIRAIVQTSAQAAAGTGDIYFEPDPGFATWIASLDTVYGGAQTAPAGDDPTGTGAMIRMFQNSNFGGSGDTIDYTTNWGGAANPDNNVGEAAAGAWFWDMGMNGTFTAGSNITSLGEVWVAPNAALAYPLANSASSGTSIGTGNAAINLIAGSPFGGALVPQPITILDPNTLLPIVLNSLVDFSVTTNIRGSDTSGSRLAGFNADSDASFTFTLVPLPMAIWPGVVLLGLLGLGRVRRRRLQQV